MVAAFNNLLQKCYQSMSLIFFSTFRIQPQAYMLWWPTSHRLLLKELWNGNMQSMKWVWIGSSWCTLHCENESNVSFPFTFPIHISSIDEIFDTLLHVCLRLTYTHPWMKSCMLRQEASNDLTFCLGFQHLYWAPHHAPFHDCSILY